MPQHNAMMSVEGVEGATGRVTASPGARRPVLVGPEKRLILRRIRSLPGP
jgi:hypothetical protein